MAKSPKKTWLDVVQIAIIPLAVALIAIIPSLTETESSTSSNKPQQIISKSQPVTFDLVGMVVPNKASKLRLEEFPFLKIKLDNEGRFVAPTVNLPPGSHILHVFVTSQNGERTTHLLEIDVIT